MTYGIVTAILVLALIAVVLAVVFATDEEIVTDPHKGADTPKSGLDNEQAQLPAGEAIVGIQKENQASDIRIMDVPAEADRDTRTIGI